MKDTKINPLFINDASPLHLSKKIKSSLIDYVYSQTNAAIAASFFCATIVLIGLYNIAITTYLIEWYIFTCLVALLRLILTSIYRYKKKRFEINDKFWEWMFVVCASLGGLIWGLVSTLLFPSQPGFPRLLCVLILAGVTAGSLPALAGLYSAVSAFLIFALLPYIIKLLTLKHMAYDLLVAAFVAYLIYLLILGYQLHRQISRVMFLQFQNDDLLNKISDANIQLQKFATHDQLTGIYNRHQFYIDCENAMKRANRNQALMGLFYIDLDYFKEVNDNYGHLVGDLLLKLVIQRLQNLLRAVDIIYRVGGDEFIIIIENSTSMSALEVLATKICNAISETFKINDLEIHVSCSIGISIYPIDATDETNLTLAADKAMYQAKAQGRNTFKFHSDIVSQK